MTMTTKRKLPIVVENSVGKVEVLRHDMASSFERRIQDEIPKHGARVTCSTGCAWCCYHPIAISILEGILIYRWLLKHRKWTLGLKERLRSTADKQFGTTYEMWLLSMIPCPLLNEKKRCMAYLARPLICRAYYAISDPYYCHPHRLGDSTQIIPRDDIADPFHLEQEKILRKHNLQMMTMPIGSALLLAERVCLGEVDLDTIDSILLKEYGEKG